jgi:hypothetical protein
VDAAKYLVEPLALVGGAGKAIECAVDTLDDVARLFDEDAAKILVH